MSKIAGELNAEMMNKKPMDTDSLLDLAGKCGATTLRKQGLGVIQFYTHELHKFADLLIAKNEAVEKALIRAAVRISETELERDTAWAQAHRLALELECLLLDTKDNAIVSKWWGSAFEALCDYQGLKPGAEEEAEAWAAMRRSNI